LTNDADILRVAQPIASNHWRIQQVGRRQWRQQTNQREAVRWSGPSPYCCQIPHFQYL